MLVRRILEYFSYKKEQSTECGEASLIFACDRRALGQTLVISAVTLLFLTAVALLWPWEDLPRSRSLGAVLKLSFSGLIAAVAEETFFRGLMQPMLRKRFSAAVSITAVNLLFAPLHLIAIPHFVSLLTFFPGLIMGWLRERYGSILPSIIFHFLGNIWAICFFPSPF